MCLSASLAISAGLADSDFVEAARTWDKEKASQRRAWMDRPDAHGTHP
jgi:hypothetical protein